MKKLRVFQAAKDFHVSSDALMEILRQLDISVKSHMSVLEDEDIERVRRRFDAEKEALRAEDQRKHDKQIEKQREKDEREAERRRAAAVEAQAAAEAQAAQEAAAAAQRMAAQAASATGTTTVAPPRPIAPPRPAPPPRISQPSQQRTTFRPGPGPRPQQQQQHPRPVGPAAPPIMPLGASAAPLRVGGGGHGPGAGRPRPRPGMRPSRKKSVDERLVREAVRKTMATLDQGRRRRHRRRDEEGGEELPEVAKTIKTSEFVTVGELAGRMEVKSSEVLAACLSLGIPATINRRLDRDAIETIADEFGYAVEFVSEYGLEEAEEEAPAEADLVPRPPVVTIMGHVDHGKTSLLDRIRKSNVVAGETGGITQHIGAYEVKLPTGHNITFLDTPGHEAFTAMRARGAQVTDTVVLVVAADDRVMPQTIEAIDHARAANVPIIVAINKTDLPGANPEAVRTELAQRGLQPEEWGGKTIMVDISAKTGENVDRLLEMINLQAEVLELKAAPTRRAKGTIIEARLSQGRGVVATILVQDGTLHVGDVFVAGGQSGKVRALLDERGRRLTEAGPSTPVQILGWSGAPQAGDSFAVVEDEKTARELAGRRQQTLREQEFRQRRHITLDELHQRIQKGEMNELNVILKGDVDGSVEALSDALGKLSTDEVVLRIIHTGVGNISESDILLAAASDAVIIGFHVRPDPRAHDLAAREKVDIRQYEIIYEAVEAVKKAMSGLLKPEQRETVLGTAEVREIFRSSKFGTVAGCRVVAGTVQRNARARLVRRGQVVWDGRIGSLRRFKDDVREVESGFECGITLEGTQEIRQEDLVESYEIQEVARELA